eukprot:3860482-Pyramimonas_sp.AAC.1
MDVNGIELGSLDLGEYSAGKEDLRGLYRGLTMRAFDCAGVDLSPKELGEVAKLSMDLGAVDVTDVCLPHRHCGLAGAMGLKPGVVADLGSCRPNGQPWDFTRDSDVAE